MAKRVPMAKKVVGLKPTAFSVSVKGRMRSYYNHSQQIWLTRAWPRGNGGDTPLRAISRQMFKDGVKASSAALAPLRDKATAVTAGTSFLPRDMLMMMAYGRFTFLRMQDGKEWMGWRMADATIQTLLDSIFNAPGCMLVRGPEFWLALLAGTDGQLLTFDASAGIPQWKTLNVDIQSMLDTITTHTGYGIIYNGTDWVGVDLSDVGDIQSLLNQLTPSSGEIAYFNGSTWQAALGLSLFDAAGAAATAQANAEAYADTLAAAGLQGYHPGYVTGRKYYPAVTTAPAGTFNPNANTIYALPFYVVKTHTFSAIDFTISTPEAAGHSAACGIYANGGAGVPTTKEVDFGTISTSVAGLKTLSATATLTQGWHYLAWACDRALALVINGLGASNQFQWVGVNAGTTEAITGAWTFSSGGMPANFPAITYLNGIPPLLRLTG